MSGYMVCARRKEQRVDGIVLTFTLSGPDCAPQALKYESFEAAQLEIAFMAGDSPEFDFWIEEWRFKSCPTPPIA